MSSTQEVGEIFGEGSGPAHAMLRSPTVLIAAVGLWGMNILMFRIFRINYVKVLKMDLKKIKAEEEGDEDPAAASSSQQGGGSGGHMKNKASESSLPSLAKDDIPDDASDHSYHILESTKLRDESITWNRLVAFSVSLLFLLHFTTYIWMDSLGGGFIGAIFSFYGSVIAVMVLPIPSLRWLRKGCMIVFERTFELVKPRCFCLSTDPTLIPRPIPFVDVYFADAMCSLSKVFFDMGMLVHMLSHYPEPVPPSTHNILIPSACAAVPYIIRARQCLLMHTVGKMKSDPKRGQHIQNAIKYSTSLWPLFLSAYQKTIDDEKAQSLEPLLILLLTINASYSLYWDVVMDWGMMQNPNKVTGCIGGSYSITEDDHEKPQQNCVAAFLRPRLRFGLGISLSILLTDAILRFSWTLRHYHALFPSADLFVLSTQFLEIVRRALWNLLRLEWEHIKQQKAQGEKDVTADEDDERKPFLPPASVQMSVPAKRPNSGS